MSSTLVARVVNLLVVSSVFQVRMFSIAVQHAYLAGASKYQAMDKDYSIEKVVVVHRHGDRSQISRTLGSNYPESEELTAFWDSKMPDEGTQLKMAKAFQTTHSRVDADYGIAGTGSVELEEEATLEQHLYAGEDKASKPYAMLTQVGAEQLMNVGKEVCTYVYHTFDYYE